MDKELHDSQYFYKLRHWLRDDGLNRMIKSISFVSSLGAIAFFAGVISLVVYVNEKEKQLVQIQQKEKMKVIDHKRKDLK